MDAQSRAKRIILGLAISGCASCLAAETSCAGIPAAADASPPGAAAPYKHRRHVDFQGSSFAFGDVDATRHYLKKIYPEGLVPASDVVADLQRAGATCGIKGGAVSCRYEDSFFRDDSLQRATWTFRVDSRPDGALARLDVAQTLRD